MAQSPAAAGTYDLTDTATSEGVTVAVTFVATITDTALSTQEWLAELEVLLRADAYAAIARTDFTATQFPLGVVNGQAEPERFDSGRLLGVNVPTNDGGVYVMLTRDTETDPWRVAWWE